MKDERPPTSMSVMKQKPRIKTASAKAKGRNLQNWVRDRILAKIKGLRAGDVVSAPMGVNGSDIQLSPHAKDILPFQFECKANKTFSIYKIFDQCKSHGDLNPVVILKGDYKTPIACVSVDLLLDLIAENQQLKAKAKK